MMGPILAREWMVAPRRLRFYAQRVVFVLVLFSLICTAWALMAGIQQVRNVGDLARFGGLVFQIVVPFELIVTMFLATIASASSVAQEKDRRTLILLLLTRLSSTQIVLGKLASSLLGIGNLILAALPLLLLIAILGGVGLQQVLLATAVILVTAAWSAALANLVAFWRKRPFKPWRLPCWRSLAGWRCARSLPRAGFRYWIAAGPMFSVPFAPCGVSASRFRSRLGFAWREAWPPPIACWGQLRFAFSSVSPSRVCVYGIPRDRSSGKLLSQMRTTRPRSPVALSSWKRNPGKFARRGGCGTIPCCGARCEPGPMVAS